MKMSGELFLVGLLVGILVVVVHIVNWIRERRDER